MEAFTDDAYWMRSHSVSWAGKPMTGLQLLLEMEQTEMEEGRPWKGTLKAINTGEQPLMFYPYPEGLQVNLLAEGGPAPRLKRCIGAGLRSPETELRAACRTLVPGESCPVLEFDGAGDEAPFGGYFGCRDVAWRINQGTYSISFLLKMAAGEERWSHSLPLPAGGFFWRGSIE